MEGELRPHVKEGPDNPGETQRDRATESPEGFLFPVPMSPELHLSTSTQTHTYKIFIAVAAVKGN